MSLSLRRAAARLTAPALTAALVATLPSAALADWQEPVDGASPINQLATRNATNSDLTTVAGVPHVVWNEDTTDGSAGRSSTIRVARLAADGTSWEKVGNAGTHPISRLDSTSSENPSIADVEGVPWVAWDEGLTQTNAEIRVARLNAAGTGWTRVPDTLRPVNHLRADPGGMAQYPTIVSDGGTRPYVSFFESDPGSGSLFFGEGQDPARIWVMRLSADGTTWEEVGGGHVNPLASFDAAFPRMTLVDGVPWVTYFQVELVEGAPVIGVRVSRLGAGGAWEQVGEPLVAGGPGQVENPDIAAVDGSPYVAMPARSGDGPPRIQVFGLDGSGTGWTPLGAASPAGAEAQDVSITEVGGEPWLTWAQRSGSSAVGAAVLRSGEWQQVGSPYPSSENGEVRDGPALADVNGFPWFSFAQYDGSSPGEPGVEPCCTQLRVARLEPGFSGSSSQPTHDSVTLLTSVEDYGLPFPVGFEYGPNGSFDSASALEPRGDVPLLFRVIQDLLPSTLYGYRPYATAGTALPQVRGAESFFVTDPADTTDPDPVVVAITDTRDRVRRGERQRVKFFATEPGQLRMRVLGPGGKRVAQATRSVEAGVSRLPWRAQVDGGPAPVGRYVVAVRLTTADGRSASDRDAFRVVRR